MAALAGAIGEIGGCGFAATVVDTVRACVQCDSALAMYYAAERPPTVLFDAFDHGLRRNDLRNYLDGAYLLDPFFALAQRSRRAGQHRLGDIVTADFAASPYFRRYYKHSRVADEVNFLVPLGAGVTLAISLERAADQPAFSAAELRRLQVLVPVIDALARADWPMRRVSVEPADGERLHAGARARLDAFGAQQLTPREREVVQLLLRGYGAQEAGAALRVATETVRVHRRNIYRKLEVSSLAELFSLALEQVLNAPGPSGT